MLHVSDVPVRCTRIYCCQPLQARLYSGAIYHLNAWECDSSDVLEKAVGLATGRRDGTM